MACGRPLTSWRKLALTAAGLISVPAWSLGQEPLPPSGPVPNSWMTCDDCGRTRGPLHRLVRHAGKTVTDKVIGYPEYFVVPPLGASVNETMGVMKAKANGHEFMLYRSDFQAGSTNLSPGGAERLSRMACRLGGWLGPLVVEWTPDQPELAEQRRAAVLTLLQRSNVPVGPERILVAASPYYGMLGSEAAVGYQVQMNRYSAAPLNYSLTPIQTSNFGYGGMIR